MIKELKPREMPRLSDEDAMKMYGTDKAGLKSLFEDMLGPADMANVQMMAMSILSDAQEVMSRGDVERARQWINKAKWLMSHVQTECIKQREEHYEKLSAEA